VSDAIFNAFLERQLEEAATLARQSDMLDLLPFGGDLADRFIARFTCRGLVRQPSGAIEEAEDFAVGICFPSDYLRRVNPFDVLTWLGPRNVWHPNISDTQPIICVGRLVPGTGLVDILMQVWEQITWRKFNLADSLNPAASEWARQHLSQLPVDTRALKRRRLDLRVEEAPTLKDTTTSRELCLEIHTADSGEQR
jgi:hypothetical protein